MAKYYGIGGKRRGSVGYETYSINKGENIVKSKIIHVNDAKTPEQVEQRSKLENALKAYQEIGPDFLKKCFENKKQRQSTYNAFMSFNAKVALPFFKQYSADKNIIGIGNFVVSDGSLPVLPVVKSTEITISEKTYTFYGIELDKNVADDANVGAVSALLKTKYGLQDGDVLNGVSIYNKGISFQNNNNEPIVKEVSYSVERTKNNFVINASSTDTLASKGFMLVKDAENLHFLVILKENGQTAPAEGCIYQTNADGINGIGYCAYFVARKGSNTKILVSTSRSQNNKGLEDLINKINENPQMLRGWLATTMKILIIMSYGIKKVVEIIRDWPI